MPKEQRVVDGGELACRRALDPGLPDDWRRLAAQLAWRWRKHGPPRRVALSGGQGTGKSTLARALAAAVRHFGTEAVAMSLDDFYMTRAQRKALAATVHPLLATRGPPGTHDVPLCRETLDALFEPGPASIPVFDKGVDDRSATPRCVSAPVETALLEGWCVGARAEPAERLLKPVNALEAEADGEGVWRSHVNAALEGSYSALFAAFDYLIFLRPPNLAAVRRWRLLQEGERPPERRMGAAEVERFVAHYERLTLWMLADMPARADVVVDLDADHRVAEVSFRRRSGS